MLGWPEAGLLTAMASLVVASYMAREHIRHIETVGRIRRDFFDEARLLVKDSRMPDSLIDFLEFMAENMNSGRPARTFLRHLWSGRVRQIERNPPEDLKEFVRTLDELPRDVYQRLIHASGAALLVSSFRDLLFGWLLRRSLRMWAINEDDCHGNGDMGRVHIAPQDAQAAATVLAFAK